MNRISRIASAAVLTAALLSSAVPAAQARTLAQLQSPSVSGSWFDAALSWLGLVSPATHRTPVLKAISVPIGLPPGGSGAGGAQPMGCSTIDPNGTTGTSPCHGGV